MTDKITSVYTDGIDVSFNLYNITMAINLFEDEPMLLGKVKMSPQTAKAFLKILGDNIASYEAIYGPILEYNSEMKERERKFNEEMTSLREGKVQEMNVE